MLKMRAMKKIQNAIREVSKGDCIVMGDFNHGNIQWDTLESTGVEDQQFMCLIQDNFLIQHVLEPTEKTKVSRCKRNFRKGNYKEMRTTLEHIDWNDKMKNMTGAESWNILKSELDSVILTTNLAAAVCVCVCVRKI